MERQNGMAEVESGIKSKEKEQPPFLTFIESTS